MRGCVFLQRPKYKQQAGIQMVKKARFNKQNVVILKVYSSFKIALN